MQGGHIFFLTNISFKCVFLIIFLQGANLAKLMANLYNFFLSVAFSDLIIFGWGGGGYFLSSSSSREGKLVWQNKDL